MLRIFIITIFSIFLIQPQPLYAQSKQKKVISWGDTYEINILDELNTELYLFIVIIIDQIIHEQRNKSDFGD